MPEIGIEIGIRYKVLGIRYLVLGREYEEYIIIITSFIKSFI